MASDSIFIERTLAILRCTALFLIGVVLASPVAAQSVYHFYESGAMQQMVLAPSEIALKARSDASDANVTEALRRHVPQAATLEKWDHRYLIFIPPPHGVYNLTGRAAAIRQESVIVESSPVLYIVQEGSGTKGGAPPPGDERLRRLAAMRIVTKDVIANLPAADTDAARIRQATGALSAAPAGAGGWWLFTYETPRDALDAAYWMAETAKLESTPLFERMQFSQLTPNDTLYSNQWHLNSPLYGINVTTAWDTRQGTGRHIALIDDGVQLAHPDLTANTYSVVSGNNYDFNGDDNDPNPQTTVENHGTAVAGLAAGRGHNGLGITGVAFMSKLLAIRLIASPHTDLDQQQAFTWKPLLTDVSSNSWGPLNNGEILDGPGDLAKAGLQSAVTNGRGGRGVVFVFAGGNGGALGEDSNYSGYANSRFVIAVGATTDEGGAWGGTESGANIAVAAPGRNLTTTDRTGAAGYIAGDYYSSFTGTSAAAPLVAGAAALLIEANPNLGYRDVKEILMRSASRTIQTGFDPFVANGAGIEFSHTVGAGLLNVGNALAMAATWTNLPAETSISSTQSGLNSAIPDNSPTGVNKSFNMSGLANLRVETVELTVNVTHPYRGDLEFVITAPSGMQSIVRKRGLDFNDNYTNWTFTSVRHWGESSSGTWNVKVADLAQTDTGTLNSLTLRIWGTSTGGPSSPDLVISSLTAPNTATAGGQINASATIVNQGNAAAGAFRLEFYFSNTPTISTSSVDTGWGCDFVGLGAGASTTCIGPVGVPNNLASGLWYFGAIADPSNLVAEMNDANNSRATDSGPITVGIPGSTTGVFRPSNGGLFLKSQNTAGFADRLLTFGLPGDKPVAGDWNGDDIDTIGVFRNGVFYLRNSNTNGFADLAFGYGAPTDLPIVGDWDGDGVDTIGVFRDGLFILRNSNTTGPAEAVFGLGIAGDIPISGDWNGDGVDTVGIFRPSNGALYLKNQNSTGFADIVLTYGLPGDKPVTGDWDGNGTDTIGVFRNGTFMLPNSNTNGFAEIVFGLGVAADEPISGLWGPL